MTISFTNKKLMVSSRFIKEAMRKKVVQIYNNVVVAENEDSGMKSLRTKNLKEDCRELRKDIMGYKNNDVPSEFKDRLMELKATADRLGIKSN